MEEGRGAGEGLKGGQGLGNRERNPEEGVGAEDTQYPIA